MATVAPVPAPASNAPVVIQSKAVDPPSGTTNADKPKQAVTVSVAEVAPQDNAPDKQGKAVPEGFKLVKVRKPDGTIVTVTRKINKDAPIPAVKDEKPVTKPDAKPQNDALQSKDNVTSPSATKQAPPAASKDIAPQPVSQKQDNAAPSSAATLNTAEKAADGNKAPPSTAPGKMTKMLSAMTVDNVNHAMNLTAHVMGMGQALAIGDLDKLGDLAAKGLPTKPSGAGAAPKSPESTPAPAAAETKASTSPAAATAKTSPPAPTTSAPGAPNVVSKAASGPLAQGTSNVSNVASKPAIGPATSSIPQKPVTVYYHPPLALPASFVPGVFGVTHGQMKAKPTAAAQPTRPSPATQVPASAAQQPPAKASAPLQATPKSAAPVAPSSKPPAPSQAQPKPASTSQTIGSQTQQRQLPAPQTAGAQYQLRQTGPTVQTVAPQSAPRALAGNPSAQQPQPSPRGNTLTTAGNTVAGVAGAGALAYGGYELSNVPNAVHGANAMQRSMVGPPTSVNPSHGQPQQQQHHDEPQPHGDNQRDLSHDSRENQDPSHDQNADGEIEEWQEGDEEFGHGHDGNELDNGHEDDGEEIEDYDPETDNVIDENGGHEDDSGHQEAGHEEAGHEEAGHEEAGEHEENGEYEEYNPEEDEIVEDEHDEGVEHEDAEHEGGEIEEWNPNDEIVDEHEGEYEQEPEADEHEPEMEEHDDQQYDEDYDEHDDGGEMDYGGEQDY